MNLAASGFRRLDGRKKAVAQVRRPILLGVNPQATVVWCQFEIYNWTVIKRSRSE